MNIKYEFDTICALATPFGTSGIAVIRISGDKAFEIIGKIFSKKNITAGKIEHGWICDEGKKIDEVVVLPFKSPASFTGEDVIEIQCHGGVHVIKSILSIVLKNGARMAEKGEFTKRAFLNGRLDLSKAEAIDDIIHSKTKEFAHRSALNLGGKLSLEVSEIRQEIFNLLCRLNAATDFPEDVAEPEYSWLEEQIKKIISRIEKILVSSHASNILRDGVKIAIVGKPNAGKSSLFNKLLNLERAIVTDIPGTTRDVLQESISIGEIPVTLTDTAGIRENSGDKVEAIGIDYSLQSLESADLVLFVFDASSKTDSDDEKIFKLVQNKPFIKVGTKTDLIKDKSKLVSDQDTVFVSNVSEENLDLLKKKISEKVLTTPCEESDFVTNHRQQSCLSKTVEALQQALSGVEAQELQDLISIDVKSALLCIDEISGEVMTDEILNNIFEHFCIGK